MNTAPLAPPLPALANLAEATRALRAADRRASYVVRQRKLASSHFQRANKLLTGAL